MKNKNVNIGGVQTNICAWCGKAKGVYISKKVIPFNSASRRGVITDYEPCEECAKKFSMGVPVLEMSKEPLVEGQLPFTEQGGIKYYPTGSYVVMSKDFMGDDYEVGVPVLCLTDEFKNIKSVVEEINNVEKRDKE